MTQGRELTSAITVRFGTVSGCVLGALVGRWIGAAVVPAGEGMLIWPTVAGGAAGLAASWAVLGLLARKHSGAGAIAGIALMAAAVAALFASQRFG